MKKLIFLFVVGISLASCAQSAPDSEGSIAKDANPKSLDSLQVAYFAFLHPLEPDSIQLIFQSTFEFIEPILQVNFWSHRDVNLAQLPCRSSASFLSSRLEPNDHGFCGHEDRPASDAYTHESIKCTVTIVFSSVGVRGSLYPHSPSNETPTQSLHCTPLIEEVTSERQVQESSGIISEIVVHGTMSNQLQPNILLKY